MGYFSNGCEGDDYCLNVCDKCYFGDKPCAVWLAHLEYNYDECNNDKSILHILIPRSDDGLSNKKCEMFIDKTLINQQGQ